MRTRLAKILFMNCLTPQATTGISPSELLLGRRPRSRLDLLKPNTADRHDQRSRVRNFTVGEDVFVRNHLQGDQWLPGSIEQKTGPVSYRVKLTNGKVRRCHQDQIRNRSVDVSQDLPCEPDYDIVIPTTQAAVPTVETEPSNSGSTTATPECSTKLMWN